MVKRNSIVATNTKTIIVFMLFYNYFITWLILAFSANWHLECCKHKIAYSHVTCRVQFQLSQPFKLDLLLFQNFLRFKLHFKCHVTVFDRCLLALTVLWNDIIKVTWRDSYDFSFYNCLNVVY